MAIIGMVGPHAIGKTTAARRWLAKYPNLIAAIADDQWEATRDGQLRVREWKGTVEQKQALVEAHAARPGITLIESVRTTNLLYFRPTDPIIIVTCSWQTMGRVLEARCKRNNKRFNAEYWTEWKLGYESVRRYLNFAAKYLTSHEYRHFEIEDQARDWAPVDEYFGGLFRRLHNQLKRG